MSSTIPAINQHTSNDPNYFQQQRGLKSLKIFIFLLFILTANTSFSQTAPAHLKYFGYALVDVKWDDPHDTSTITNYTAEVSSFSNIAQLGGFGYTDTITSRVDLMNALCVKPLLSIQSVFYYAADTNAPSGTHFVLYSDFKARWDSFIRVNRRVLTSSRVAAFYVADEPVWNGITFAALDTVCQTIRNAFPAIPLIFVEAYPVLEQLAIPTSVDWVGFDRYEVFDPTTSRAFLNDLDTLKSKLSAPNQKIFLVIDDQWLPRYGIAGFSPDTMRFCVQNYYNLAASDTTIIGLIGYLWAGGLDDLRQLGVRDMPQSVIDKNRELGLMIKNNTPTCPAMGTKNEVYKNANFSIYPTVVTENLTVNFSETANVKIKIYSSMGALVNEAEVKNSSQISTKNLAQGLYLIRPENHPEQARKFIKQ